MVEMYKSCIEGYWVAPQPHLCPLLKDDVDFTIHHFINNRNWDLSLSSIYLFAYSVNRILATPIPVPNHTIYQPSLTLSST